MKEFQYVTNAKGIPVAVQIDLRKFGAFFEDFYDAWMVEHRKDDERISWEEAKKMLPKSRKK